jgi:hypothetical protein
MQSEWTLDQELLEKTQSVRTAARVSLNDRKTSLSCLTQSVTHARRRVTQSVIAVAQSYAMLAA